MNCPLKSAFSGVFPQIAPLAEEVLTAIQSERLFTVKINFDTPVGVAVVFVRIFLSLTQEPQGPLMKYDYNVNRRRLTFAVRSEDAANLQTIRSLGGTLGNLAGHSAVIRLALKMTADALKDDRR